MPDWGSVTLEDVCDELTVGHVGSMATEYIPDGIPFLRSQNVRPGHLDLTNIKYVSAEFHQRLKKSQLKPGDIVIVRTGEPGAAAVIPEDLTVINCSDLVIVRPGSRANARFLCYAINATARAYVDAHLVGAVQQHFNVNSARKLPLRLPPLDEQRAIVEVLGALDNKITVNDQVASAAEALAITLGSDERWASTTTLLQLVDHVRDQVQPMALTAEIVAYYSIPAFDSGRLPDLASPASIKSSKFRVDVPAVLVSKLNPSIPRIWNADPSPQIPALASTEFLVLRPRPGISTDELWTSCMQPAFTALLTAKVTGTSNSHQRVKPDDLLLTEVVDPRVMTAETRSSISALMRRAHQARVESLSLRGLHNTLLPKLMSGEIRVREAERVVEDAT